MERRINSRIDTFMHALKQKIAAQFEEVRQKHAQNVAANPQLQDMQRDYTQVMNFIYESDKLKLSKDDFAKRKRVKNAVPVFDRCHAKRANGEQCTRRKKEGCLCCGTHTKGTPHGMFDELDAPITNVKVETWVQDIKGIMYHIDSQGNVYDPEDIVANKMNPNVIAKYVKHDTGTYSIPTFVIQ
jgi:hypothetical protein|uniref:Uncharacterized protein n=1 Tax=viral metagenome TaxID=1070528 RepID=A0A6C0M0E8_9ZZZZ